MTSRFRRCPTSWPRLLSYALSFVIVGVYWVAHHHVFHHIRRLDRTALWLNIFFLMSVAFVPFPTALLGEYGDRRLVAPDLDAQAITLLTRLIAGRPCNTGRTPNTLGCRPVSAATVTAARPVARNS